MNTTQIYQLVNDVNSQAFGSSALAVNDPAGLISLGNTVLSSSVNTEAFMNTLIQRVGRSIVRYRMYSNKLRGMVLTDFEWGAILQKIYVHMPVAEADEMYSLVDGQSIDHYVVSKPQVDQKLFVTRAPYRFKITVQRQTLKEAFTSESAMGAFISAIFGQVQNKIEVTLENLGRLTLCTGIAEASQASQNVKLLTEYNAIAPSPVTAANALVNGGFLRYAIRRMKETMDNMTDMSTMWNDGTLPTFTPFEDQRIVVLSQLQYALETEVEWAAFNDQYVKLAGFTKLNFWQAEATPQAINVKKVSDGTTVSIDNCLAVIHDRDAMGIYQEYQEVLTTPVNASGNYVNSYYHRRDGRLVDRSENCVYFTLD